MAFAQLGSFAHRKNYIVESDSVSGSTDLTDFPVLISITDADFIHNPGVGVESANGFDIAFSAGDGTTALDFQLESYNSGTGEIIFWVRFPTLSANSDTQFFIYYGDNTIVTDQSSTSTWNSNYQLVMHMDGGATETDLTSNGNDGTGTENGTGGIAVVTGQIGSARDFERGDGDFISVPDDASLDITGEITMSFWFNQESAVTPDFITKGTNAAYEAATRNGIRTRFRKNNSNALTTGASFPLSNATWVYLTYVQTSSGMEIYQDGELVASNTNTTAFDTNNDALQISRSGDAVDGIMDEVRISDIARNADWIATEYNNQFNPSTFIEELPDVPSLGNIESSILTYTAGGSAVFITSTITVNTHPTITDLDSAIVQITGNLDNPDDQLNFTNQLGITGTYTASTGELLLTGTTTLANYQTALRAVTYSSNEPSSPSTLTRTVSFTGYYQDDPTNVLERDIDIIITLTDLTTDIPSNVFHFDAQDLDGDGTLNSAEASPPTDGSAVSTWGDLNSTNNFDFTTGNAATFDSVGFGERGAITYDGAADELIRASDPLIDNSIFTQKSFAFTFRTGASTAGFQVIYEQGSGTLGYNFSIVDGTLYAHAYSRGDANWGASNAVRHRVIDLGTVQTNESYYVLAYHDTNIWAAQVNGGTLESFDDAAEMPALSGTSTLGGNVNNTRKPDDLTSTGGNFNGQLVEFASWNTALNGGQRASLNTYFDDKWGNTAPVLAAIEGTNIDFAEADPDVQITNTITITDADTHLNLDSAKVSVTTNFVTGEDSLIFVDTSTITGSYNETTGVLLLTGFDTIANYQTALRSVNYRNSTVNPTVSTRTIEFEVYDWDDVSNTQSRNVNVTNPDFTPILANLEGVDIDYDEGDGTVTLSSAITIEDFDDTNIENATISITNNYILGEDFLDFTDTGSITGSFASGTGILTLSGSDTKANYETALRAVTYENTSGDPLELTRTVSFVVNDGDNNSNTVTRDINVTALNTKPELTGIESENLQYPDAEVQITNTIVTSDPDDTNLDSAFVIITENFKPAEDSLIYSTLFGITGTWNSTTGVLKLEGNNLLSDYQAALRSVEYVNTATIASGPERVVGFVAHDGELASDTLKRTIDVSPVETIADLEVWLRADTGISEGDGVPITTWADQSGNGNDYTGTAQAGTAPAYVASSAGLNSQPSVSFAGDGDHFEDSDGDVNYIDNSTEFTLFSVIKSDVTGTDRGIFHSQVPDNEDKTLTIRYDAAGANGGGSFTDVVKTGILGNNADNQLESFSDIQTTDAQIISLQWLSGTTYDIFVDGILNNPSSAADPPPAGSITASTTAILGKGGKDHPNVTNQSWDGEIAEFIYYSRNLTEEERQSVEDYLSDKYDIPIREITPATGGEAISADDANTTYTALTGPFVQEGFIGEFTNSGTFVITVPTGYEWNTGATVDVTVTPAFGGSTELDASFTSITATDATFTIDAASTTNPGQLEFTGLEIRPTTGTLPNNGNLTNTGSTGQGGATNYGNMTMVPGAADSLVFVQQPSATNVDSVITPEVRVQLVDQFGNNVEQASTSVSVALSSGTGNLTGTTAVNTNALGIASFDDLVVDDIGTKELETTSAGLSPDTSSTFEIVNAGTLTSFVVERSPSGSISSKSAGQSFNIAITAVDGTMTTVTTFNGTVVISASCTMGIGQGTTASFTNGVLSSHTVSITSVGTCDITATNSAGSENGTSNSFTVSPGAADETTSTITASPTVILNDGASTSVITVDLFDEFGNDITSGGDVIVLSADVGTLATTVDNGDGTYSDTLTSTTNVETATITGTVNAVAITDDATVEFAAFTHIWDSQLGSASDASNWEDAVNWNVGTVPGASSVVLIPATPAVGNEFPVIDVGGASVTSVSMESGAELSISGGINFTITGDISGGSVLGSNADSLTVGGDILDVTSISVGTVVLDGSSAQTITNPHQYVDLTIDNSSGVTVSQNLNISGTLTLTSGQLLIPAGTEFISDDVSYGSGELRFQREVTGVMGWRLLSSPVDSDFDDFLDGTITQGYTGAFYPTGALPGDTLQPNVLTYLESFPGTDNQRYRAPTNATDALTEGEGMFVFFFGNVVGDTRYTDPLPDTLDVAGQEFNGDGTEVTFPITYTASADTGWNLVGNPFGATIDWDDDGNWTKTNVDNTIYVWDPAANGGNGEYLSWNGSSGTLGSGLIAPFQGFWIKANAVSPVLKVDRAARTTGGTFLRKQASVSDPPEISFEVSAEGLSKVTNIMFSPNASINKDNEDAYRLTPFSASRIDAYTLLEDGTQFDINALPVDLENRYRIPLQINGFLNGQPIIGDFTIKWVGIEDVPDEWIIKLIDKETGEEFDLLEEGTDNSYTFFYTTREKYAPNTPGRNMKLLSKSTNTATRFTVLVTTADIEARIPQELFLHQNYPNPFNPTTIIEFGLDQDSDVLLEVFDILGRKIQTLASGRFSAGRYPIQFDARSLASGVYIYRLRAQNKILTEKMTLIR